jgi:hypothetical protein
MTDDHDEDDDAVFEFVDPFGQHCRVCTRYIKKLRIVKFDSLCCPCWRKLGPSLRLVVDTPPTAVETAGVFPGAGLAQQERLDRHRQDISGPSGVQIAVGCRQDVALGPGESFLEEESKSKVPLSSRGRYLSGHLLWSERWLDFTSRLEKKHQNLDKLEMDKGQFTDSTAMETDSMGSDVACDVLDEGSMSSDWEDSTFGSYMDDIQEESESDASEDLAFMVEDSDDQDEGCYVFDCMEEEVELQWEEQVDSVTSVCCHNCRREGLPFCNSGDPVEWSVVLGRILVSRLCFRHRWKSFSRKHLRKGTSHITLCKQCERVLSKRDPTAGSSRRFQWKDVWPIYIWKFLSDTETITRFGSDALHFIPKQWWKYWQKSLVLDLVGVYSEEDLLEYEESTPVVVDCTVEKRAFKGILARKLLGQLKQGCDKYLEAKVLCPWGCSGFTHNAGCVSYDAVMSHFFPF